MNIFVRKQLMVFVMVTMRGRVQILTLHLANYKANLIIWKVILRESINFVKQTFLNFKQIFLL